MPGAGVGSSAPERPRSGAGQAHAGPRHRTRTERQLASGRPDRGAGPPRRAPAGAARASPPPPDRARRRRWSFRGATPTPTAATCPGPGPRRPVLCARPELSALRCHGAAVVARAAGARTGRGGLGLGRRRAAWGWGPAAAARGARGVGPRARRAWRCFFRPCPRGGSTAGAGAVVAAPLGSVGRGRRASAVRVPAAVENALVTDPDPRGHQVVPDLGREGAAGHRLPRYSVCIGFALSG